MCREQEEEEEEEEEEAYLHCNSVWSEISSGSLVLKAAEEILSSDSLQLDVVAEGVHSAGAFNGISTLNVIVVREEELSGTMEWSPSTLGLFRSIVPAHTQLDVIPAVCFNLLYLGYIGRLLTILCAHQDSVTHCQQNKNNWTKTQSSTSSNAAENNISSSSSFLLLLQTNKVSPEEEKNPLTTFSNQHLSSSHHHNKTKQNNWRRLNQANHHHHHQMLQKQHFFSSSSSSPSHHHNKPNN
jgi:hypothetical protein